MSYRVRTLFYFFTLFFFSWQTGQAAPTFTSSEHSAIGDSVKVYISDRPGEDHFLFHLPSGVTASYGEVLVFGDIYGVPGYPISMGTSTLEQRARFLKAFASFALDQSVVPEAENLLQVIHDEEAMITQAMQNGSTAEDAFAKYGYETGRRFNCITGGGCDKDTWWLSQGRYLKLAKKDYDHFGNNAWVAYQIGHSLAMETAILAKNSGDLSKLKLAYAMNAFACHFLADRFSAGHIRTPRVQLPEHVSPSVLGSVLTNYMHNEENQFGLHVHNIRGDHWQGFGDQSYFSEKSNFNRRMLTVVMQISADQIFTAFKTGEMQNDEEVFDAMPFADEVGNANNVDTSPLFYWDNATQKLFRRVDVQNPYDRHWTDNWWGWSTLSLLIKAHGKLPGYVQSELANSEYAQQAIKEGYITNPAIIAHINQVKK